MFSNLVARLRSLGRAIRHRSDIESEMAEEFRLHVELRTADLIRWGLTPAEATRQARLPGYGLAHARPFATNWDRKD